MVQQLCYGSSWEVGDTFSLVESKLQMSLGYAPRDNLVDASKVVLRGLSRGNIELPLTPLLHHRVQAHTACYPASSTI
jgi:hypothetical protein